MGERVVTGHHGLRPVLVNGIPCRIRDLRSIKAVGHNGESSERESAVECEDSESPEPGIIAESKDSTQTSSGRTDGDDLPDSDEKISPIRFNSTASPPALDAQISSVQLQRNAK